MPAPPQAAPLPLGANGKNFAWMKHIQTVESAIRIADFHFAETLINILIEIAELTGDHSQRARLKSQQARIKIESKQLTDGEQILSDTIYELDGTPHKVSVGAAYCYHALAQCYNLQGRKDLADKAQYKSIRLAEEVIGPAEPETNAFRQKLL